ALGSVWCVAVCGGLEALAHLGAGRLGDARTAATGTLASAAGRQLDPVEGQAHAILAEVALRQGDLALARAHADLAVSLVDDAWGLSDPSWQLAQVTSAEGQPATAIRAVGRALDGLRQRRLTLAAVDPSRLPLVVRLSIGTGDRAL